MSEKVSSPTLPKEGYVNLKQILQFIPVRKTAWYAGVKSGKFPRPVKYGRLSFYPVEAIREVIERIGKGGAA